ncbi:MAG: energy transducer TonB [Saprospiraceae bacterium]
MGKFSTTIILLFSLFQFQATAQEAVVDTTVYQIVDQQPRFPGCEQLDTTLAVINQCSQANLLSFVYKNLRYPLEARQNGNEGTVVANFIVEPDSTISDVQIVRDIGGGTGGAVLELVNVMNQIGVRWTPGKKQDKDVRTRFTLPVKFKLKEAPPYIMSGRDTIYTTVDTPLTYAGGDAALVKHIDEKLEYPAVGNDSCMIGAMDAQVLVERSGKVRILDLSDYSNLGIDYQFTAISAITSTIGNWTPAMYQGRNVPTSTNIRLSFIPTDTEKCKTTIENFRRANDLAIEGAALYEQEEKETGLMKLSEAIDLFPDNAEFLYTRGQIYLNDNQMPEACADLTKVKSILSVGWFDNILPLICK